MGSRVARIKMYENYWRHYRFSDLSSIELLTQVIGVIQFLVFVIKQKEKIKRPPFLSESQLQ